LTEAEQLGIVFGGRDIKSENLLLTAKKGVKVCDFGLARSALEVRRSSYSEQTAML
jgi:serine/threonine protein kinase